MADRETERNEQFTFLSNIAKDVLDLAVRMELPQHAVSLRVEEYVGTVGVYWFDPDNISKAAYIETGYQQGFPVFLISGIRGSASYVQDGEVVHSPNLVEWANGTEFTHVRKQMEQVVETLLGWDREYIAAHRQDYDFKRLGLA